MQQSQEKAKKIVRKRKKEKSSNSKVSSQGTSVATLKNIYETDSSKTLSTIIFIQLAICALMGLLMFSKHIKQEPDHYFTLTEDYQLLSPGNLEEASIPSNVVLNWYTEVVMKTMTFNFTSFNTILGEATQYFTVDAYKQFITSLRLVSQIKKIKVNSLIVSTRANEAPQITDSGYNAALGRYVWRIVLPVTMSFRNSGLAESRTYNAIAVVMRVSREESPIGLKIHSFAMEPYRSFTDLTK